MQLQSVLHVGVYHSIGSVQGGMYTQRVGGRKLLTRCLVPKAEVLFPCFIPLVNTFIYSYVLIDVLIYMQSSKQVVTALEVSTSFRSSLILT
jgi:hypothetical protein